MWVIFNHETLNVSWPQLSSLANQMCVARLQRTLTPLTSLVTTVSQELLIQTRKGSVNYPCSCVKSEYVLQLESHSTQMQDSCRTVSGVNWISKAYRVVIQNMWITWQWRAERSKRRKGKSHTDKCTINLRSVLHVLKSSFRPLCSLILVDSSSLRRNQINHTIFMKTQPFSYFFYKYSINCMSDEVFFNALCMIKKKHTGTYILSMLFLPSTSCGHQVSYFLLALQTQK